MNFKVKYSPVKVKDPEKARDFLVGKLGFTFSQKTTITDDRECILVGEAEGSGCCLMLLRHNGTSDSISRIVINTADCLKDYHDLISEGAKTVRKPQYTALGLIAEIEDGDGNNYTLLEERDYKEK